MFVKIQNATLKHFIS